MDYTQLKGFWDFIDQIRRIAPAYDYVCARERRCFNLVARFLPKLDMISTQALTLKYDEIAEYYCVHRRFPRILILDDLLIHGRGIAKLLQQMEDMLALKLLDRGVLTRSDNYRYTVCRNLADAVTIYVYARNTGVVFLADDYLEKLRAGKRLYASELRDLSLQLSDKIGQWDIANTSYVYSVRSELITKCLLAQQDGRIGSSEWVRRTWNYGGEEMILYARLNGGNAVNRVDTVRFFPGRCNDKDDWREPLPLLTSFSFFGDLPESSLRKLFAEVYDRLIKAGLYRLANILKPDSNEQINRILMQTQTQLISFILSVAMLLDFCREVIPPEELGGIMLRGDIWKISCNFGRRNEIAPELLQICQKALRTELKQTILRTIDEAAEVLIPVDPQDALRCAGSGSYQEESVNHAVRRMIYAVGMESEKAAYELSTRFYRFAPDDYQENCGKDGIIHLGDLVQKKQMEKDSGLVFSYLAAFIAMMDTCTVSVRTKTIRDSRGEMKVCTLAKAGEMASFYLPEKTAMLIPVFAELESNTFASPAARKRNLKRYLDEQIRFYFGRGSQKLHEWLGDEEQVETVKKAAEGIIKLDGPGGAAVIDPEFLQEIDLLYDGGHTFYGWNFRNMTAMRHLPEAAYQGIETLRKHLINEIEMMYSYILPPQNKNTERERYEHGPSYKA